MKSEHAKKEKDDLKSLREDVYCFLRNEDDWLEICFEDGYIFLNDYQEE